MSADDLHMDVFGQRSTAVVTGPDGGSASDWGPDDRLTACCLATMDLLGGTGLSGVALARIGGSGMSALLFASDPVSRALLEIQETLGEGPAQAVQVQRGPVIVPDLSSPHLPLAWQFYAQAASEMGVRSHVVLPVQIGAVMLGVLCIHGTRPANLDPVTLARLMEMVHRMAETMIASGAEADGGADQRVLDQPRAVIHQAAGMVMVQLDATLADALAMIRARAYADGTTPAIIAAEVVNRRLRFGPDSDDDGSQENSHG